MKFMSKSRSSHFLLSITFNDRFWRSHLGIMHLRSSWKNSQFWITLFYSSKVFDQKKLWFKDTEAFLWSSKPCLHPYETIKIIARSFWKEKKSKGQLMPKHRGGVCYPILQDDHIQWLVKRLDANPNITVESLHR